MKVKYTQTLTVVCFFSTIIIIIKNKTIKTNRIFDYITVCNKKSGLAGYIIKPGYFI